MTVTLTRNDLSTGTVGVALVRDLQDAGQRIRIIDPQGPSDIASIPRAWAYAAEFIALGGIVLKNRDGPSGVPYTHTTKTGSPPPSTPTRGRRRQVR